MYRQAKENVDYNEHQTVIAKIGAINGEVCNGGFEQYLWNGTADEWPKHRSALQQISADKHIAILDRVTQLFGETGPPTERAQRHKPLAKVARKHGKLLDECNSEWYEHGEELSRLKVEYALKHPDSFRP